MQDIFVARQPIFDDRDRLYGYEILFRANAEQNHAGGFSQAQMATDSLVNTLLGMGLDMVTGQALAFFNVSRDVLLSDPFEVLDPGRVVIEVLETVACDPQTLDAVRRLRRRGFTVALDDFEFQPSLEPFLREAQIIKLDVLNRDPATMIPVVERLRPYGCRLLAERVESAAEAAAYREMGFTLFQGYFYARPEILAKREMPVDQVNALHLMNLVRDLDSSDVQIEAAFRADLSLTYKLLRIVNSAAVGGRGVDSIGHALRLLGREPLFRWLALLVISSMASRSGVGSALVTAAVLRARMCELLATESGQASQAGAQFITGLFSHLDALMRAPMADVLSHVALAEQVRAALLHRDGPYAHSLRLVEAYERARWDEVATVATQAGVCPTRVPELYREAVRWAAERVELASA